MATSELEGGWMVDIRVHSAIGLPESEPFVACEISCPTDPNYRWTSKSFASVNCTAFMGAWTSIVIPGDELRLSIIEKPPILQCFRAGLFNMKATLKLTELATQTANLETGGNDSQTPSASFIDLVLDMDAGRARFTKALDAAMNRASETAEEIGATIEKVDDKVNRRSQAPEIEQRSDSRPTSADSNGIYSAHRVKLRISIRVTPLTTKNAVATGDVTQCTMYDTPYVLGGGVLEQPTKALPQSLWSYAHGGFMGLACTVLSDPLWSTILKEESPDAWKALQLQHLKLKARGAADRPCMLQGKYMIVLENSPIMCAFGLVRCGSVLPVSKTVGQKTAPMSVASFVKDINGIRASIQPPETQAMDQVSLKEEEEEEETSNAAHVSNQRKTVIAALSRYQEAMCHPNQYGYKPLAMEWDIWCSPHHPESLEDATINHGTKTALVSQTVLTTIPGLKGAAKMAGASQILDQGLSPIEWLTQLGHSINRAVNGDKEIPLPLAEDGNEDFCWKFHVSVQNMSGIPNPNHWNHVWITGDVDSDDVVLPDQSTGKAKVMSDGTAIFSDEDDEKPQDHTLTFWPLPRYLKSDDLLLIVHGNPDGVASKRGIGIARLSLEELVQTHPNLLQGEQVECSVELGPWVKKVERKINVVRSKDETHMDEDNIESKASLPYSTSGTTFSSTIITLQVRCTSVPFISALESMGVPRAAAQTSIAMLSQPGGLYLDVKSAYSSAYDLQCFVSTLKGVGITVKAVCSFQPKQLLIGCIADTVLFFHGLSGLENACDGGGSVSPGQFVLFNGASFLANRLPRDYDYMSSSAVENILGVTSNWPYDELALRKFRSLVERFGIVGGFYVQEPDTAPAAIDALCCLVADNPDLFPLGFAYGHLSGKAVGFFDAFGPGFGSQQIVEEFAARKSLSGKARKAVAKGYHREVSLNSQVVLAGHLLRGEDWMSLKEQRSFCCLLAEMQPEEAVSTVIKEVGGLEAIVARFHQHYELTTPLTLMEAGFNLNYTKSLLRIVRNRGVLASLSQTEKMELSLFMVGPALRGYGATYVAQATGIRIGLHKHAKEGLLCLLESSTRKEVEAIIEALGGQRAVERRLCGWVLYSRRYSKRLEDIMTMHNVPGQEDMLAYKNRELKYSALSYELSEKLGDGTADTTKSRGRRWRVNLHAATHTRNKTVAEQGWRATRKSFCCICTCFYTLFLEIASLGTFLPCCVLPRVCGNTLKGACGLPAVFSIILGFILAIGIAISVVAIKKAEGD